MRNLIIGVSLLALAGAAVAQVTPVPDAAAIVPTPLDAAATSALPTPKRPPPRIVPLPKSG